MALWLSEPGKTIHTSNNSEGFIGINFAKIDQTADFNDKGEWVIQNPALVIAHELDHFVNDHDDPTGAMSASDYNFKGDPVIFQNIVAQELGLNDAIRSSYRSSYDSSEFEIGKSYTDGNNIDISWVERTIGAANLDTSSRTDNSRDLLIGNNYSNIIRGGGGDDYLYGRGGEDILEGGSGVDVLVGGTGDDILRGGSGNDILWGGEKDEETASGIDTVDYSGAAKSIKIILGKDGSLVVHDGDGGMDTLHAINEIKGTEKRDLFTLEGNISEDMDVLTIDANGGQGADPRDTINLSDSKATLINIDENGNGSILDTITSGVINLKGFHTNIVGTRFNDQITDESFGDKRIDGGEGWDTITVTNGAATIYGGDGRDVLTGGSGNDVLVGGEGGDQLYGGDGNDLLIGGDTLNFTEVLEGGNGNDMLVAQGILYGGNVILKGGAGNDLYKSDAFASDSESGVIIEFRPGDGHDELLFSEDEYGDPTTSIHHIDMTTLTNEDVKVVWNATPTGEMGPYGKRYMSGNLAIVIKSTGDSILFRDIGGWQKPDLGGSYPTIIHQGPYAYSPAEVGLNVAIAFAGDNYLTNHLWYGDGSTNVDLEIGDTSPYDHALADWNASIGVGDEVGTSGDDEFNGTAGSDTLDGGTGNDSFEGSSGNDIIDGGDGDDTLNLFGGQADYAIAASGQGLELTDLRDGSTTTITNVEKVYFAYDDKEWATSDLLPITGTESDDTLIEGTSGDNHLFGLGGDDVLMGKAGDDVIDGGDGTDIALYQGLSADYATGQVGDGSVLVMDIAGGDGIDRLYNIEALQFDGDSITKQVFDLASPDEGWGFIYETANNDITYAGPDGTGLTDSTFAVGGDGFDILYVKGSSKDFSLYYGATFYNGQRGVNISSSSTSTIFEYEAVYFETDREMVSLSSLAPYGSVNDDVLTGSNRDDMLYGEDGNDTLKGLYGSDVLIGGNGDDILVGGRGGDRLSGGAGNDIFIYNLGDGFDRISGWAGDTEGNDELQLGAGILASQTSVIVSGNDATLSFGSYGSMIVLEGVIGSSGVVETIRFNNGTTWDAYDLRIQAGMADQKIVGTAVADTLTGADGQRDILIGLDGSDELSGLSGNDTLLGGAGDDILTGGAGDDDLQGGDGIDRAVFTGNSTDYVFSRSGDVISVEDSRATSPDGADTASSIEEFYFAGDDVIIYSGDIEANTNSSPELVEDIGGVGFSNYSYYDFSDHFYDADNDPLSYSVTMSDGNATPDWLYMVGSELHAEMPEDFYDALEVTVWASDGQAMIGDTMELYIYN